MGKELIINGSLLIAFLFFFYQLTDRFHGSRLSRWKNVIHGLTYGLLGVLLMLFTVAVTDHVIMDFRMIPIMLAAFFCGPFAAVLSALLIGTARVTLFGLSFASEIAVINLLLCALGCSLIRKLGGSPRAQWFRFNLCTLVLSSIVLMVVIPDTRLAVRSTVLYCLILIPVSLLSFIFADNQLRSYSNARELKRQEQELRDSRNRLSITLDSIGDGVISTNAAGEVRYLNPVAAKLTGWSLHEAIGQKIETVMPIFHETSREPVLNPIYRAIEVGASVDMPPDTSLLRRDGTELPIDDSASPIYDESGAITGVVLVFRDIQERRLQEERIRHYAFHDSLTGLPNRRLFHDRLAECLHMQPKGASLALLFIDLDHFKLINDSLGHEIGDLLLIEVARRLKECVREQDTVSRLAGDEFTVILNGVTLKEAGDFALYIKQSLGRKYKLGERECFTSPSIGISMYPQDAQDAESLIKCADTAMYHVKTHEKNHFRFFSADMTEKVLRKVEIDKGLRSALETDSLRLEYQPKIDLLTGELTGFEALLRWDHPEWGPISPDEFIPVAEESGLIIPLGEWVLRTGCRQFRKWLSTGNPGERLAVNLSVKQLQDPGLPALVERVLEEEQLSASQLELEITETIMKQGEHTVRILEHLKNMGIYISIDDFGTGYSSLSYLNRLPIDALKIDKSFIRNIYTDHADSEIVTTIITLAKSLNLKVIAEGVETREQLDFLKANNCHEGQGYLIGRPSRPESIEQAFLIR
ncbi:putative bifunctional diguanylate cyclase/phosphodiesterase [Gorillibacterium timonense]|uniref:putative bifunctional diguanylate cyclase/phosphodiesterase n=1 Tax=Gorillibacterium timonense TaxID=1689269 RepID=UPI00071D4932|nr:EAL domain-containing protein [Gorillibacterium timonense]